MKTLKLVLIAAFFATALISQASADKTNIRAEFPGVSLTFDRAIQNHALVVTMYAQLDPEFLGRYQQLYVVNVFYNGMHYKILGSRQDFVSFFSNKWNYLIDTKTAGDKTR
jgi:hypothetical protein